MVIIWNREVATPLSDFKQDNNLLTRTLKMFKKYINSEINKAYGYDVKSKSVPLFENKKLIDLDLDLIKTQSEDNEIIMCCNKKLNSLSYELGNNFNNYQSQSKEDKNNMLEEVYTFDFQAKYFIEQ